MNFLIFGFGHSVVLATWWYITLYNQYFTNLLVSFYKNAIRYLQYFISTFITGLVCFFNTKAFLILAIIIAKIIYLGFLASYASRVALIMWISRVLSSLRSSIVSYIVSYLGLGLDLVLGKKLVLDLGLGSLSIFFIVEYQFSQYFYILSLSFCLVQGGVVVILYRLVGFLGSWWMLAEILGQ